MDFFQFSGNIVVKCDLLINHRSQTLVCRRNFSVLIFVLTINFVKGIHFTIGKVLTKLNGVRITVASGDSKAVTDDGH